MSTTITTSSTPESPSATMSSSSKAHAGESSKTTVEAQTLMHSELENDFAYGTSVATCAAHVRLGFIRKVYGILAAQLGVTAFICAVFMFITPIRNAVLAGAGVLTLISVIGTFVSLFGLIAKKDSYPANLQLLGVFTVSESILVGTVCARYAATGLSYLVLEALVITFAVFAGITLYAFTSKRDFSFLGGGLFAALLALLGCGIINLFLGVTGNKSPALAFLMAWGGSVLFSLYILYDTSLIMHHMGPDDAILGAVSLYLDILNLFLHILAILSRNRD